MIAEQYDLFGNAVYTPPHKRADRLPAARQHGLFDPGMGWMTAAENYCRAHDLRVGAWMADQTFQAIGLCGIGRWYAVERNEDGELEVIPLIK